MQPSAHIQAALDLLADAHLGARTRPMDKALAYYFKNRRYIGSKDKKNISELVYGFIRHKGLLDYATGKKVAGGRLLMLAYLRCVKNKSVRDIEALFDGERFSPEELSPEEQMFIENVKIPAPEELPFSARYNIPAWLEGELTSSLGDDLAPTLTAMLEEAPTDIRVNTLKTSRPKLLNMLKVEHKQKRLDETPNPTPFTPNGLRYKRRQGLFVLPSFKDGLFEVQDAGSQLLAALSPVKKGQYVIDMCAGAGGKTLALAAKMGNKGRILACDVAEQKLTELKRRLKRAGVDTVATATIKDERDSYLKRHKNKADVVFLDVPCSGSGTWRRNPDGKWHLTADKLNHLSTLQKSILASGARLVKNGGYVVYATCSVLAKENSHVVQEFTSKNPNFKAVPIADVWQQAQQAGSILPTSKCPVDSDALGLQLLPHIHKTDGFYVAVLKRIS